MRRLVLHLLATQGLLAHSIVHADATAESLFLFLDTALALLYWKLSDHDCQPVNTRKLCVAGL